jgi:hypothetical protein
VRGGVCAHGYVLEQLVLEVGARRLHAPVFVQRGQLHFERANVVSQIGSHQLDGHHEHHCTRERYIEQGGVYQRVHQCHREHGSRFPPRPLGGEVEAAAPQISLAVQLRRHDSLHLPRERD